MIDRITQIHDANDPRIRVFCSQRDAWLRAAHNPDVSSEADEDQHQGLFMGEGSLVVEHLIESPYSIESVLVGTNRIGALGGLLGRVPGSVPIYCADQPMLESIVGFPMHRGLLACGRRLPTDSLDALIVSCRVLVVLEDLANHDNIGSVFRSAACLVGEGVGVVLSPRCCDPLYRKALRVSMGHALRIPFAVMDDWPGGLRRLSAAGFRVVAMSPGQESEDICDYRGQPGERLALLLGAEGPGLSTDALANADKRVRIEQARNTDSLNISVACAVGLHRLVQADPQWGCDDR
ncbi:MAG: RNA methyltransferase [Phycisphaerales bacterium]|nr:RNA methyltransferase [Phycisphaerales bacterium]